MKLTPETMDMSEYLVSSEIIDFEDPDIQKIALSLSKDIEDEIQVIRIVYEFVRDNIFHSADIGNDKIICKAFENRSLQNRRFCAFKISDFDAPNTSYSRAPKNQRFFERFSNAPKSVILRASDVLRYGHGLCFANSHLLAAFLRYLGIPTGFCYQKVRFNGRLGLHGLNAVFIKSLNKWVRLDACGNGNDINAQFSINHEFLAYSPKGNGEVDFPVVYAKPDKKVVEILSRSKSLTEALDNIFGIEWWRHDENELRSRIFKRGSPQIT